MLLIDSGNTRIKWMLVEDGITVRQGSVDQFDGDSLCQSYSFLPPPCNVIVSNVAGAVAEQCIISACASWPCTITFLVAAREQGGVRNCYELPSQLGSDRWAALIAAWNMEHSACLVVNCGTATTIDMLSSRGEFLGGLILPGIKPMLHALADGTAMLRLETGTYREFPLNTADSMYSGAIQATTGAIHQQYNLLGVSDARCLLSGGASGVVTDHLHIPFEHVENIVLLGLQIIGLETRTR